MVGNLDRGKAICSAYRDGMTLSQISRAFKIGHSEVNRYLKRYFEYFYGEKYIPVSERLESRATDLYAKYNEIYVHGVYNRTKMCEMLGCSIREFEYMSKRFGLHHQWLKTYAEQVTLCNVPNEFKDSIMEFAKKYGFKSCRAVAVRAINEFMLQYEIFGEKEKDEDEGC